MRARERQGAGRARVQRSCGPLALRNKPTLKLVHIELVVRDRPASSSGDRARHRDRASRAQNTNFGALRSPLTSHDTHARSLNQPSASLYQ